MGETSRAGGAVAAFPLAAIRPTSPCAEPQVLREAVEQARTFLSFRVERALASSELKTGEGRAHAAEAALAMVAEHPNELVRDQYLVTVSDRTRLDLERLRPRLDALVRAFEASGRKALGDASKPTAGDQANNPMTSLRGSRIPKSACSRSRTAHDEPDTARITVVPVRCRRASAQAGRTGARGSRTTGNGWKVERGAVRRSAPTHCVHDLTDSTSLHEAIEKADDEVADLLRRLAVTEPDADPDQTVTALARTAAQVALGEIEADARQAEAEADTTRLGAAGAAISWLKAELELLQEPGTADRTLPAVTEAANRLVAWLLQRYLEAR